MKSEYDTVTPTNPHTRRDMREIAGTSIGIIMIAIGIVILIWAALREPVYAPSDDQRKAAEEAIQRR